MSENTYHHIPAANLVPQARTLHDVVASAPGVYPVDPSVLAAFQTAIDDLTAALGTASRNKSAYAAAITEKNARHDELLSQLSRIARTLYNAGLASDDIARTGLALYDATPTPRMPRQPLYLVATPETSGTVRLAWDRNGNPRGATFVIEARREGTNWTPTHLTTKTKAVLAGFEPGIKASFRVRAAKNDVTTLPSNVAVIYPSGSDQLKLQIAA